MKCRQKICLGGRRCDDTVTAGSTRVDQHTISHKEAIYTEESCDNEIIQGVSECGQLMCKTNRDVHRYTGNTGGQRQNVNPAHTART